MEQRIIYVAWMCTRHIAVALAEAARGGARRRSRHAGGVEGLAAAGVRLAPSILL